MTQAKKEGMKMPERGERKTIDEDKVNEFASGTQSEKNRKAAAAKAPAKPRANGRKKKGAVAKGGSQVKRDSFTMPLDDYDLIDKTMVRLMKKGILLNKGEILRAGLHALKKMKIDELVEAAEGVEKVKTGRPVE